MSFTTIAATTLGIADGDQSPTPVSGTVRITPRHPAGTIESGGVIATGPVIVTITGGAFPSTAVPAREDSTALVEFHLYTTDGPVRMPDTEIPLTPGVTINLRDHLPIAIDPATGRGLARGDDGAGITDITAQNGQITILWEGGGSRTIDVPDAVQGVGVQDATQPAEGKLALTLTDGSTTSQVTLPDGPQGRDGSNVLPTGVAIAEAIAPEGVARTMLDTAIGQLAVTSPSVGRIITSTDPTEPLTDGEVLLVYQGPRAWTERFDDGLFGMTPRWNRRGDWSWATGAAVIPVIAGAPGSARKALSLDALGDQEEDVELLAEITPATTTSTFHHGIILQGSGIAGSETGWIVGWQGTDLNVGQFTNGSFTSHYRAAPTITAGTSQLIRARTEGGSIKVKSWPVGGIEPGAWNVQVDLVGGSRPGWCGLVGSSNIAQRWERVAVATQGGTAVLS